MTFACRTGEGRALLVPASRLFVRAFRDLELAFRGAGHSIFVDGADDHTGAITFRQIDHFREARLAVFIVSRVENAFSTGVL